MVFVVDDFLGAGAGAALLCVSPVSVGGRVGAGVGETGVGKRVGYNVSLAVGAVGAVFGFCDGCSVRAGEGFRVSRDGIGVGGLVGTLVSPLGVGGAAVGVSVGADVGADTSSSTLWSCVTNWPLVRLPWRFSLKKIEFSR